MIFNYLNYNLRLIITSKIFFFSIIGSVLTFNTRPELFDNLLFSTKEKTNEVLNKFSNSILTYFDSPVDEPEEAENAASAWTDEQLLGAGWTQEQIDAMRNG